MKNQTGQVEVFEVIVIIFFDLPEVFFPLYQHLKKGLCAVSVLSKTSDGPDKVHPVSKDMICLHSRDAEI